MKAKTIITLGALSGLAIWLGFKIKDAMKLTDIDFAPSSKPFQFHSLKSGIAKFVLNLIVDNPSAINLELKSLVVEAFYKNTYLGRVSPAKVVLNANSKSPVSLPMDVITSKLVPFVTDLTTRGRIDVTFKVLATLSVLGKEIEVPYDLTIDIKDALREYLRGGNAFQQMAAKLI